MSAPQAAPERPRILCVDDEPQVLEGLRDTLRRGFDVHVAGSGPAALARLSADPRAFAVVISDMRMPAMSGAAFLQQARRAAPLTVRMLLTGDADTDTAVRAVNDGQIFRFLIKPCDRDELQRACEAAVWQHRLLATERRLLEETLRGCVQALTDVLALASPAAFGRAARIRETVVQLAAASGHDDAWEIEVAAMLAPLGAITLPAGLAEKLADNEPLTSAEQQLAARVPAITQRILGRIPRLEAVQQILDASRRRFDSMESGGLIPIGARTLRIAVDLAQLETAGVATARALETMRASAGVYDPALLALLVDNAPAPRVLTLAFADLRPGMRLANDLRAAPGHLLVASGSMITPEVLERLGNFPVGYVREPIHASQGVDPAADHRFE